MIELRQKASFLESDVATPISAFLGRVGRRGSGILLESAEVGGRWGRYTLVCVGAVLRVSCQNGLTSVSSVDSRLKPLARHAGLPFLEGLRRVMADIVVVPDPSAANLPPIARALYGYLGYGLAGLMEPSLSGLLKPESAEASMTLPASVLLFDHAYNTLTELTLGCEELPSDLPAESSALAPGSENGFKSGEVVVTPAKEDFLKMVAEARELIAKGELIQMVLSVGFESPCSGNPFDVYRRLRRLNPSPYMFYLQQPDISLVVSSPEVLVSCARDRLRLCPIAGTRPRGQDSVEDDLFESELIDDPKEQAEHVMLVDLGRNDLGRVAKSGSVEVVRFMEVERFSHVMHLTSHLGADLAPNLDALDVVTAAFPAGTLSGAPKIKAMELIAKMEGLDRGPYGGAIGWLGLDKDSVNLDLGITIRSLWTRDGQAHFRAGAGIVYDSVPENEWRECLNKAAAIMTALAGAEREVQ
ncbi:MAG: anthranilate synthase component I family protein [Deltaproteobacteria bacterium]|jgi:anthranilate synthase component 1|nr:anthranilate synthase component I family protein [Deltaproteobacteria bacterium]